MIEMIVLVTELTSVNWIMIYMSLAYARCGVTLSTKPCQDSLKFMHFTMCYRGLIGTSLIYCSSADGLCQKEFSQNIEWLKTT